eukprot:TRINITY_DN3772_c1_g2_i1.p1 TRINITY_DN3772_c1_g2~~TRINITY_DN3772_c1_g2_i1.p1  ORF type:complete len:618 (-),score=176.12 TRINITY_DN3772_c1_g2_i1:30-1883(-)
MNINLSDDQQLKFNEICNEFSVSEEDVNDHIVVAMMGKGEQKVTDAILSEIHGKFRSESAKNNKATPATSRKRPFSNVTPSNNGTDKKRSRFMGSFRTPAKLTPNKMTPMANRVPKDLKTENDMMEFDDNEGVEESKIDNFSASPMKALKPSSDVKQEIKVLDQFNGFIKDIPPKLGQEVHKVSIKEFKNKNGNVVMNKTSSNDMFNVTLEDTKTVIESYKEMMFHRIMNNMPKRIQISPVGHTQSALQWNLGMVCPEEEGKLKQDGVTLEGSIQHSNGRRVKLKLANSVKCRLFPGQILLVQGINLNGRVLAVNQFFPSKALACKEPEVSSTSTPLSIWVANGPFQNDNFYTFDALQKLATHIIQSARKPDVLILNGPFVDVTGKDLSKGELVYHDETTGQINCMDEETVFEEYFCHFLGQILETSPLLKIILVPSTKDAMSFPVFPQAPLELPDSMKRFSNRIILTSNPSILNIDGIPVANVNVDVFGHFKKEELHSMPTVHPNQRALFNILEHASLYPIFPSGFSEDDYGSVDLSSISNYTLPCSPDLLITTSDFHGVVVGVQNTLALSPGSVNPSPESKLTPSYARILVVPPKDNKPESKIFSHRAKIEIVGL